MGAIGSLIFWNTSGQISKNKILEQAREKRERFQTERELISTLESNKMDQILSFSTPFELRQKFVREFSQSVNDPSSVSSFISRYSPFFDRLVHFGVLLPSEVDFLVNIHLSHTKISKEFESARVLLDNKVN